MQVGINQFSNGKKITSAENLRSRASDEIVPFREFIIKDDTSALLWFVRFFNGSFRFIRSLIYCSDNGESFLCDGSLCSRSCILNGQEWCATPTSWNWSKHAMLYRIVFGAIWRVMYHDDIYPYGWSQLHQSLFYYMVRTCIRTATITENTDCVGIWVFPL